MDVAVSTDNRVTSDRNSMLDYRAKANRRSCPNPRPTAHYRSWCQGREIAHGAFVLENTGAIQNAECADGS